MLTGLHQADKCITLHFLKQNQRLVTVIQFRYFALVGYLDGLMVRGK
jgi:hypothetical protein